MYKDVLRSIEGVDIYPVIGIIIFFTFFLAWLFYVIKMKKESVDSYSMLPLDLEQDEQHEANNTNQI
ncbi:CcoQ/FixQ family Cbb3-type cytochrome c oxidase assembly chaperone [Sediminitomix flava]|uniref:Cbb3-type cytochrome oxidase component FixQ n=1 Tax=Sediminitomix flava TaxID=379075 RepID=A0A315Z8M5_SEDFL|nr:CcoQ/FixQ family Cbb3-type cytochrome c oxidase assembly chaperone [Sediminitomix flava]PWJ41008.1 hypothetical protein BC781_104274 [Sediminitomix flava]